MQSRISVIWILLYINFVIVGRSSSYTYTPRGLVRRPQVRGIRTPTASNPTIRLTISGLSAHPNRSLLFLGLPRSLQVTFAPLSHRSGFLCLVLSCPDLLSLCFFVVVFLRSCSSFLTPHRLVSQPPRFLWSPFCYFCHSSPVQFIPASQPASLRRYQALEPLLRAGEENTVHFILFISLLWNYCFTYSQLAGRKHS